MKGRTSNLFKSSLSLLRYELKAHVVPHLKVNNKGRKQIHTHIHTHTHTHTHTHAQTHIFAEKNRRGSNALFSNVLLGNVQN